MGTCTPRATWIAAAASLVVCGCEYESLSPPLAVEVSLDASITCETQWGQSMLVASIGGRLGLDARAARIATLRLEGVRVTDPSQQADIAAGIAGVPVMLTVPSGTQTELPRQVVGAWQVESCPAEIQQEKLVVVATFLDLAQQTRVIAHSRAIHPRALREGTCVFPGRETTECGRCIARKCQAWLDATCDSSSASADLLAWCAVLSSCAQERPAWDGTAPTRGDQCYRPPEGVDSTCLETGLLACLGGCDEFCVAGAAPNERACTLTQAGCRCEPAFIASGEPCTQDTLPDSVCCFDPAIEDCSCVPLTCSRGAESCYCSANAVGDRSQCERQAGEHCCLTHYSGGAGPPNACVCGPAPCDSDAVEVDRCSRDEIGCTIGVPVTECP